MLSTLNTGVDFDGFWAGFVLAWVVFGVVIPAYMGLRILKRILGS